MVIMAVDFGQVRTGLAVCDESEILASPLAVVAGDGRMLVQKIVRYVAERRAEMIVVGLPVNMDGTHGKSAKQSEALAEKLRRETGLPVILRDERLTTVSAHKALNETNTRGQKRKAVIDAVAAVLILEDYLRFRRNKVADESLFDRKKGFYRDKS